jgi:large subunit ribosomal protein L30
MTTRKKAVRAQLKITQVRSIIGNQERVKRVVTDGLGLRRIGSSVTLPDNAYTRGMIAKAFHIVRFEEIAVEARGESAEAQPANAEPTVVKVEEPVVEEAAEAAPAAPVAKKPRAAAKKATKQKATTTTAAKPRAPRKRPAAKSKE